MKIVVALAAAALLSGCSLSNFIKSDTSDYTQTYDEMTNVGLVTNILRARDYAPLNFSALSDIHMQMTLGGSLATTMPVGPFNHATTRATLGTGQSGINASVNPSIEIAPLDTQEFTRGILTPIDPVLVKYYMDREMPQKLLMFLVFSQIKTADITTGPETGRPGNPTKPVRPTQYFNDPSQPERLEAFASYIDEIIGNRPDVHVVTANRYTGLIPIGPKFTFVPDAKDFKDMTALDPAKFRLQYTEKGKLAQLYSVKPEPEIVFCRDNVPLPMVGLSDDIASNKVAFPTIAPKIAPPGKSMPAAKGPKAAPPPPPFDIASAVRDSWKRVCNAPMAPMGDEGPLGSADFGTINIRSVEAIIQYLGALLRNPQSAAIVQKHLGYSLMTLSQDSDNARFTLSYMGDDYYVRQVDKNDRTLQVLALLTQLVSLNKVAKEIPTTRDVEVIP